MLSRATGIGPAVLQGQKPSICGRGVIGVTLVLALSFVSLLLHAAPSRATGNSRVLSILVVGDSYSAGNGAGDYYGAKGCRQSHKNYAEDFKTLVEAAPYRQNATVVNAACSGATTDWILNPHRSLPAQKYVVDHGLNRPYDLIFLTIGGNDIYFADLVHYCLIARLRDGVHCREDLDRALKLLKDGTVKASITGVLGAIEAAADPRAKIVLMGYPYLEGDRNYQLVDRREGKRSLKGDPCVVRQSKANFVTAGKCLYEIEDLGDSIQQQVVDELNAQAHTSAFVFVKTKKLFQGPPNHELFAKRNNKNRWFIQPFVDAAQGINPIGVAYGTLKDHDVFYHPNPTGWYQEARLLLRDPRVPKQPVPTGNGGGVPASSWAAFGGAALTRNAKDPTDFTLAYAGTFWGGATHPVSGCDYTFSAKARLLNGDGYGLATRANWDGNAPSSGPVLQYDPGAGGLRSTEYPDSEGGTVIPGATDDNWHTISVSVHGDGYQEAVDGSIVASGTTTAPCQHSVMLRIWRSRVEFRNVQVNP
jgi:lysophospholipase L1-like esterase